jgi:threonine dehydrogenase-like Zn-dependent dehydrogenase
MRLIHMKELTVLGACRSLNAFDPCLNLMRRKKINTRQLADVIVPLRECGTAMQMLRQNKEGLFKAVFAAGEKGSA